MKKHGPFNAGDIVECQHARATSYNGIQFRLTSFRKDYAEGVITKTIPSQEVSYPVGNKFTWGASVGLILVAPSRADPKPAVIKVVPSEIDKSNLGDVVEIQYGTSWWNGIQFQVIEYGQCYYRGKIVKTTEKQAKSLPVGSEFTWSCVRGLVIIPEQLTENHVYMDHLFERLTQTISTKELMRFGERVMIHAKLKETI